MPLGTSTIGTKIRKLFGNDRQEEEHEPDEGVASVLDRTGFEGDVGDTEVVGRSPMSYIVAAESVSEMFGKQTGRKLAQNGIEDPEPDEWYPLSGALQILYDMREEYGGGTVQTMGRKIPEYVEFPPGLDSVEEALRGIDAAYHQNHRGGEIGSYEFRKEGRGEATAVCENPYPCDLDQGLIRGVAGKFADSAVHVEEVGDGCRADGAPRCEYRVEWVES